MSTDYSDYIREQLPTRRQWKKVDYEDFYERDVLWLLARVEALEEALTPFYEWGKKLPPDASDVAWEWVARMSAFRRAVQVMEKPDSPLRSPQEEARKLLEDLRKEEPDA